MLIFFFLETLHFAEKISLLKNFIQLWKIVELTSSPLQLIADTAAYYKWDPELFISAPVDISTALTRKKRCQLLPFPLWPDPISKAILEMRHKYSELVCKPGIKGLSRKLLSMTLRKGVRSSLPRRHWRALPGNSRQVRDVSSRPSDFPTHCRWRALRSSAS